MSLTPNPLRVAVIGAGAFGRNHLRVFRELEAASAGPTPAVQLAAVVDANPTTRADAATRYAIPAFASVDDLLIAQQTAGLNIHAASVCVPTIHHATVASQLLEANLDVIIEKPFAATVAEADALIALAASRRRILQIGHLERFNPAVTAALERLNRPMFFESHRLSIFTPRALDVDVVLDLMIHDLDIVLAFAQSPVADVRAVGLPILSPNVDIANVRVEFASGAVANFTASRVSTEQVRKLRLFQPHQYLSLDFARQQLLSITVDPTLAAAAINPEALARLTQAFSSQSQPSPAPTLSSRSDSERVQRIEEGVERPAASTPAAALRKTGFGESTPLPSALKGTSFSPSIPHPPEKAALAAEGTTQHPTPGLNLETLDPPRAEPLRLELEDFLRAIATCTPPRVTAEAGRAALALALQIGEQIRTHRSRTGLA